MDILRIWKVHPQLSHGSHGLAWGVTMNPHDDLVLAPVQSYTFASLSFYGHTAKISQLCFQSVKYTLKRTHTVYKCYEAAFKQSEALGKVFSIGLVFLIVIHFL